jgi:acyl carrier protein
MKEVASADTRKFLLTRYSYPITAMRLDLAELPDDFDFLLSGVIDSFGILEMISAIENEFQMQLDLSLLAACCNDWKRSVGHCRKRRHQVSPSENDGARQSGATDRHSREPVRIWRFAEGVREGSATNPVAPHLAEGALVVLESTTYPGTTEEELRVVLEEGSGMKAGSGFHLAFSPEREDPANEQSKVKQIPKVVGGYTPACLEKAMALYGQAIDTLVPVSSCRADMLRHPCF